MKKWMIIIGYIYLWCGCAQEKPGFYTGGDGMCFYYDQSGPYDSDPYPNSYGEGFLWSGALRDTLYFRVMILGNKAEKERTFSLRQSTALSALDSQAYYTSRSFAVAGVNYVAFDDPEMKKHLVISPDSSHVDIPLIMLYNPAIAGTRKDFRLHFELVPTDDLPIMDPRFYRATVKFSQREY